MTNPILRKGIFTCVLQVDPSTSAVPTEEWECLLIVGDEGSSSKMVSGTLQDIPKLIQQALALHEVIDVTTMLEDDDPEREIASAPIENETASIYNDDDF